MENEKNEKLNKDKKLTFLVTIAWIIGVIGVSLFVTGFIATIELPYKITMIVLGAILMIIAPIIHKFLAKKPLKTLLGILEKIEYANDKKVFVLASMCFSFLVALVKLILGIFTSQFFIMSAIYSACMGFAHCTYLLGYKKSKDDLALQHKFYFRIAVLIFVASLLFVIYMTRQLFIERSNYVFSTGLAIALAAISFTELFISIRGAIKSNGVLNSAQKNIKLTSSLMAIVLTQVAILSFAHQSDPSLMNAISGVVFGGLSVLVSVIMFVKYIRFRKRKN